MCETRCHQPLTCLERPLTRFSLGSLERNITFFLLGIGPVPFPRVSSSPTRFYWVLLGFTGFYWVLLGYTRLYLGNRNLDTFSIDFHTVPMGFTGFEHFRPVLHRSSFAIDSDDSSIL